MSRFINLKSLFAAALVAGGLSLTGGSAAQACDTYGYVDTYAVAYAPECYWKTVTVYETVTVPEYNYVTKYDCYNEPYQVKVVTYRTFRVAVEKQVKVCY